MGKNRNKELGKATEREVCAILTEVTGKSWVRVPNSGSFIGRSNASRMQHLSENQVLLAKGDVIPPEEYKHFIIEAKHRQSFSFTKMYSGETDLSKWIDQMMVDHKLGNSKFGLVVFKVPLKGLFVCVEETEYERMDETLREEGISFMKYRSSLTKTYFNVCIFNQQWIKRFVVPYALPSNNVVKEVV